MISSPDPGNVRPGDLVLIDAGGARRTLASNISWGGGGWPLWSLDSKTFMVRSDAGGWELIDVTTSKATPVFGSAAQYFGYFAWSGNGAYLAHQESAKIVVTRSDGLVVHQTTATGLPECNTAAGCPSAVQAVSDDGRYVAVGTTGTDPGHKEEAHYVIDMTSGKAVTLPAVTGTIKKIFFRPDGGMVLQTLTDTGKYTLYLVGPDRKTATIGQDDPNGVSLVAYRP